MQQSNLALLAAASLAMSACDQEREAASNTAEVGANAEAPATDHKDPVESAMAAAPDSIARAAAIVTANPDGSMMTVREGSNGWTCMPDNPVTPGPDPMCMDGNAAKWAAAWIGKKEPPPNAVGIMYMLEGGTDASNVDPYATGPTEGNAWIETGPHIMMVGSKEALAGYPSGAKPDTSAPYVMWAGTPYAHLMIPVDKS